MSAYDVCLKNLSVLKSVLQLPTSNILSIDLTKHDNYEAVLIIDFIVFPDVFYPVTEKGYIYLNSDGTYKTVLPKYKDILAKGLEKRITDILFQV